VVGETMLLAVPMASIRENSTCLQTGLPSETGGIMNTGSSKSMDSGAWRDLYKAALFEALRSITPDSRSALREQRKHSH